MCNMMPFVQIMIIEYPFKKESDVYKIKQIKNFEFNVLEKYFVRISLNRQCLSKKNFGLFA